MSAVKNLLYVDSFIMLVRLLEAIDTPGTKRHN